MTDGPRAVLALQPCDVSGPNVSSFLTEHASKLKPKSRAYIRDRWQLSGNHLFAMWSHKNSGPNYAHWSKLRSGDSIIFYAKKTFFAQATIHLIKEDEVLTEIQWPGCGVNEPCLIVYSKPIRYVLSVESFNEALGYKSAFRLQGFRVLDEEQTEKVMGICPVGAAED